MSVPIARNVAGQEIGITLWDGSDIKTTPTIAAGDIQISMDWGAFENITAAEDPAASGQVKLSPTQAQTNAVHLGIRWIDQAGAEWDDGYYSIFTETTTIGAIGTVLTAITATLAAIVATLVTMTATLATILAAVNAVCGCVTAWFAKAASNLSSIIEDHLIVLRGDTLIVQFTGIGDITTRDNIWFSIKGDKDNADDVAIVQCDEDTGLLFIDGAAATVPGNATITVTDAVAGDVTVRVEAVEMAKITVCTRSWYDLQVLWVDTTVSTVARSRAKIIGDVSRVTS